MSNCEIEVLPSWIWSLQNNWTEKDLTNSKKIRECIHYNQVMDIETAQAHTRKLG